MAVPTITSITPDNGYSFGVYVVRIDGTNFRIPDMLPGSPVTQESVRVFFDGVQSDFVEVMADNELSVRVPPSEANPNPDGGVVYPYVVDVLVQNIDAAGVPIPGEEVTLVGGFSYVKFDLESTVPTIANVVWSQLIRYFKRHLDVKVVGVSHVDYTTDSARIPLPEPTEESMLILMGPTYRSNPIMTERFQGDALARSSRKRTPVARDFIYDVIGTSNSKWKMDRLMFAFDQLLRSPHNFTVQWDGADYEVQLWMEKEPSNTGLLVAASSVTQFQAQIRIDGVPMASDVTEIFNEIIDIELTT